MSAAHSYTQDGMDRTVTALQHAHEERQHTMHPERYEQPRKLREVPTVSTLDVVLGTGDEPLDHMIRIMELFAGCKPTKPSVTVLASPLKGCDLETLKLIHHAVRIAVEDDFTDSDMVTMLTRVASKDMGFLKFVIDHR